MLAEEIPRLAEEIPRLAEEIPGSYFWPWVCTVVFMFGGFSLPSRVFSSQSLMDGESLISAQKFDGDMTEEALLLELKMLEDRGIPTIKCIKSHCKTSILFHDILKCWFCF